MEFVFFLLNVARLLAYPTLHGCKPIRSVIRVERNIALGCTGTWIVDVRTLHFQGCDILRNTSHCVGEILDFFQVLKVMATSALKVHWTLHTWLVIRWSIISRMIVLSLTSLCWAIISANETHFRLPSYSGVWACTLVSFTIGIIQIWQDSIHSWSLS